MNSIQTRMACLLVPDFPLCAERRAHPELDHSLWAVASGAGPRAELLAVSPKSQEAGVQISSTVAQARAIAPHINIRMASPALQKVARQALLDVALSVSPRAALAPKTSGLFRTQTSVFVDAMGVKSLFGSEKAFASVLAARAEKQQLCGVVVVASSRTHARLIARQIILNKDQRTVFALNPEEEKEWLAPLPIDLLDPSDRVSQMLTRLGVYCIRDLLRLPRRALTQRMGPEILELLAHARGESIETPLAECTPTHTEEAIDLESPIGEMEPLKFVLRGMISRLTQRLALRNLACEFIDLALRLEDGGHDARRIHLAAPSLDVLVLLRVSTLALSDRPPNAAIESITLTTEGRPIRTDQLDLFVPNGPHPTALDQTLAELESLCGEGRVGTPQVPSDHHPAEFTLRPFSPPRTPVSRDDSKSNPLHTQSTPRSFTHHATETTLPALRALRPPIHAEVQVAQGGPHFIRSAIAQGRVINVSGPWRTTGRWWSESERFAFDHFDVQMQDGIVARLCFDWIKRVWQIDGIYD